MGGCSISFIMYRHQVSQCVPLLAELVPSLNAYLRVLHMTILSCLFCQIIVQNPIVLGKFCINFMVLEFSLHSLEIIFFGDSNFLWVYVALIGSLMILHLAHYPYWLLVFQGMWIFTSTFCICHFSIDPPQPPSLCFLPSTPYSKNSLRVWRNCAFSISPFGF